MSTKRYVHSSFIHNISKWKQPRRNKCWPIITIKYYWTAKKNKELWTYTTQANSTHVEWTQSCRTLCDLMDYTVHGILQARILEWVAIPFSRRSSQPRDRPRISCIAGRFFTSWATREALSERSEMPKGTYCRIPLIPSSRKGKQIYGYHCARE